MLSKTERDYLQGKINGKINPNYKRRLHHSIKIQVIQVLKDFPLLLNLPKQKQNTLFCDDRLVGEAVKVILKMWQQAQQHIDEQQQSTYHAKRIARLMMRLEEAKIPYDVYRLDRDPDYRAQIGRKLSQSRV
jgi:hypothetical protein